MQRIEPDYGHRRVEGNGRLAIEQARQVSGNQAPQRMTDAATIQD